MELPSRFFFELLHVLDPSPLARQTSILALQGQLQIRVVQKRLQADPEKGECAHLNHLNNPIGSVLDQTCRSSNHSSDFAKPKTTQGNAR
jgi:hypothetical protein